MKKSRFLRLWMLPALCLSFTVSTLAAPSDVAAPQSATSASLIKATGKVLDESGEPIPGATVMVKGSPKGVITDVDGNFDIDVSPKGTLVVSFLGMETQNVAVSRKPMVITLKEQTAELDEVTVVAYGKQRKASVIGAISTITTEDLRSPVGMLSNNLAGKLAGVVQMQRSGAPGTTSEFWIRGVNTFGANSTPLILVDGVERSMDLVDPNDIATFSILKDATATALYGVRGANGIVVITTKRGTESAPKVSAKVEFGMTSPVRLSEMANAEEWIKYYNDITLDASGRLAIQPTEEQKYLTGVDPDLYPNVNWLKTLYNDQAYTTRVNLSVTGGTPKVRYYIGGAYYTESSLFNVEDKDRYDAQLSFSRINFRANVDINVTSSTVLGLSLSNIYKSKNRPATDTSELYWLLMRTTPISVPTKYSTGEHAAPNPGYNPYNILNYSGYCEDYDNNSQALATLTQDFSEIITPGLKADIRLSWDAQNGSTIKRSINPPHYVALGRDDDGNLILQQNGTNFNEYMTFSKSNWGNRSTNLEASLNYDNLFNDQHRVGAMVLFTMRNYNNNFPSDYQSAFPYRNIGLAGRFSYSFDDRYFTEFNFGYNGSENFAPKKRFGFFPSVAVGYIISNEKFWEDLRYTFSLVKFKASYGTIGNDQIGGSRRFAYNTTMNTSDTGYLFGEKTPSSTTGISTGVLGNEYVQWEKAVKKNLGIELGLFNSSLNIQADVFSEKRSGIFIEQESVPTVVGQNVKQYVNLGVMTNKGFELSVEYNKTFGDWYVSGRGTYTFNRNRKRYDDKPTPVWAYQSEVDQHYPRQTGLIALGLFESEEDIANSPKQTFGSVRPGDIKYRDINGDGIIDDYDVVTIGYTVNPEITYGFGGTVAWHGIDFSIFFQGVAHVTRIIGGYPLYGQADNIIHDGGLFKEVANNRWSLDNPDPNAEYPRLSITKVNNNMQASTYWLRDMSFLRLKNIELGYTIPKKITSKAGLSGVRIYLQGVNMLTFSKFKLWDPELSSSYGNEYPQMKTAAVGLSLNF